MLRVTHTGRVTGRGGVAKQVSPAQGVPHATELTGAGCAARAGRDVLGVLHTAVRCTGSVFVHGVLCGCCCIWRGAGGVWYWTGCAARTVCVKGCAARTVCVMGCITGAGCIRRLRVPCAAPGWGLSPAVCSCLCGGFPGSHDHCAGVPALPGAIRHPRSLCLGAEMHRQWFALGGKALAPLPAPACAPFAIASLPAAPGFSS